jgi:hypothetical protein
MWRKSDSEQSLGVFDDGHLLTAPRPSEIRVACSLKPPTKSIDLDRSRQVAFGEIVRKPAPSLEPRGWTVNLTVKTGWMDVSALRINGLECSLTIEWE